VRNIFTLNTPVISGVKSGGDKKVKVTWGKVPSASKYALYYSTSKNGTYTPFGAGTTKLTATVDKLSYNKYYFKVQAVSTNPACNSGFGEVRAFNTLLPPKEISGKINDVSVNLSWSKAPGATGYRVYHATSAKGNYKRIKTVKKNKNGMIPTEYSDSRASTKKKNYYKVKAIRVTTDKSGRIVKLLSDFSKYESFQNLPILAWPVHGQVTSEFGYRIHPTLGYRKFHNGIDIGAARGTPVHAAASGKVISAGWGGAYGNLVKIDHGNGMVTYYAHNTSLAVKAGTHVERGQVIAYAGSTGRVTGPHCHFEVRIKGRTENPRPYLQ
jgi:murein DD-endopeptidase MepM/ murein hydrolase activator NlpD